MSYRLTRRGGEPKLGLPIPPYLQRTVLQAQCGPGKK
jgi:hypothetical protein